MVIVRDPEKVDGPKPSCRLRPLMFSAEQRAILACVLLNAEYLGLTNKKAAALVGISASYLATFRKATPEQRSLICKGELKLSQLHNKPKPKPAPSDEDIKKAIAELRLERVWRVIEQMTEPELPLVAAE